MKKLTVELFVDDYITPPTGCISFIEMFNNLFSVLPFSARVKRVVVEDSVYDEPVKDYNDKRII